MTQDSEIHPSIILGTGPAGLLTAAALAKLGVNTACLGPDPRISISKSDTRTIALLQHSVALLKFLDLWDACATAAEPLKSIRLIDDTGNRQTAPEVTFLAREIGEEAFGYSIPNALLIETLYDQLQDAHYAQLISAAPVTDITETEQSVDLKLQDGSSIQTKLLIGADGKNSASREAAGIRTITWDHGQTAIACTFEHTKNHNNISSEFHRKAGPFTTVPLPGNQSGLVWVEKTETAQDLAQLPDNAFAEQMHRIMGDLLGKITHVGPRTAFPLSVQTARSFGRGRIALIGEAAHTFPPIGAQGLNLSFRDAATIAECTLAAKRSNPTDWATKAVSNYASARRIDIWTRTAAVDILNRSLITDFPPFQALRSFGLHALRSFSPLRKFAMHQGMEPVANLPKLMRPGTSPADI